MLFLQLFLLDGGSRAQLVFFFIIRLSLGCQSAHRNSQREKKTASEVASAIQRRFIIDLHEIIVEDDDVGGDITEPHVHLFLFLSSITRAVALCVVVFSFFRLATDDKVKRSAIRSNFNIPLLSRLTRLSM